MEVMMAYDPNGGTPVSDASNAPIRGVGAVASGTKGVIVLATATGNVDFTFSDGSTLPAVPVVLGLNFFPFLASAVAPSGTGGATATFFGAK